MKTLGDVIPELEAMLAWAKQHPDLPTPYDSGLKFISGQLGEEEKRQAVSVIRALPNSTKHYGSEVFTATHMFGDYIGVRVVTSRAAVCTRRVVETKEIPEQHLPATIIPARVEEVVEWDCEPILATREPELSAAN